MNKLILILSAALLLGGCTLGAKKMENTPNTQASPTPTSSPMSSSVPDQDLDEMPKTTTGSDTKSIETDLNATVILEEDFSDLD